MMGKDWKYHIICYQKVWVKKEIDVSVYDVIVIDGSCSETWNPLHFLWELREKTQANNYWW